MSEAIVRQLEIEHSIAYKTFNDGSSALVLSLGRPALDRLLVELFLLSEGLAERLVVTDHNKKLSVTATASSQFGTFKSAGTEFAVSLAPGQFEYACSFLLKYYRDGLAEVDHIDVELHADNGSIVTLVVKAEDAKKPMSGSEAKRLLDLE